jgi:hypothetical protein
MFLYLLFDNLLDGMVRLWGISGVSLGLSVCVGWFGLGKRADLGLRCCGLDSQIDYSVEITTIFKTNEAGCESWMH